MLRSAVSRTTLVKAASGGASSHADGMHPNLGLHNAAATGNIGLVKYALENGQPANSNLNGILPLHAACSGGSEQSVRMLIFHGADVNAPRLKAKGASGGPGAEGSTPLHFAAANGHLEIVRILLEAGARPAAADKDGIIPEALALGNGHVECANLIRSWISAYGSNGLAGMVESRDTVSGDVTLGPAGYIRYAASGRSASPISPTGTSRTAQSSTAGASSKATTAMRSASVSSTPYLSSATPALAKQSSSDTLSAHAASKLAASRSSASSKSGSLTKPSSNPNLRNQASAFATPPLPVASPSSLSASQSTSASTAAVSPGLGGFPTATQSTHDSSDPASANSRSSSVSSAVPGSGSSSATSGSVRESKRRPSLPSILEKAAHPAASLRAALASGSSSHMGGSMSQASSSRFLDQSYDGSTTSPAKKHSKLAGKRSLSNMLRKATGSSNNSSQPNGLTPSMHNSTSSFFADASAANSSSSMLSGGTINMDALAKPGRTSGKSFDYQRPSASSLQRGFRRNTASESSSEDPDAWKYGPSTAVAPPLPTSRSEAVALDQQRRLRSASSSSSLSAAREQFAANGQARRARAGSNEQPGSSNPRLPLRANASLDLLRPGHFSQAEEQGPASTLWSGRKSAERNRAGSLQSSRIDPMKRAGSAAQTSTSDATIQRTGDAAAIAPMTSRDRSVSGSSSRSAGTTDNDRSHAGSTMDETADEDDLQEFIHHNGSDAGDRTLDGSERHDSHRLPASLRTMTALRQQNSKDGGDSSATEAASSNSTLAAPGAAGDDMGRHSNVLANRMTRDRSGSHVSVVSSGSSARGVGSASTESGARNSPGLAASYQALSIAEENGLATQTGPLHGIGSSSVSSRDGRAPSVAESLASHASSSSLRSNYLSAAEQAQAILNHETPYASDGPDGTSTSLAAQLAAYGEALAQERRRAGDARSGPSPSLSARGSNAALRSKLPSVSEDQSPSRSANHSSRSFSVSESRTPNLPATAAQSYNRRVSRRPHSSEGRQSQDGGKRPFGAPANMTIGPGTLSATDRARLGLDRSQTPSSSSGSSNVQQGAAKGSGWQQALFSPDNERAALAPSTAPRPLGSPMQARPAQGSTAGESPAEPGSGTTLTSGNGQGTITARGVHASDRVEEAGPTVPPKDRPRRRHDPVKFSAATGIPVSLGMGINDEVAEVDDEDEDDPKTPVLGGSKSVLDKFASSPRSLHRHSPSMPTELSSYTAARQERSSGASLGDSGASSTTSLTPPVPPPRKESINDPALGSLGLEGANASQIGVETRMLTPDSAMWSSWRAGEEEAGREKTSSRWEGLRRPSLNMLRSATSSSTQSQTPSQASYSGTDDQGHSRWSTDETVAAKGDVSVNSTSSQTSSGTGKRRLVRTLLNKAKGSS